MSSALFLRSLSDLQPLETRDSCISLFIALVISHKSSLFDKVWILNIPRHVPVIFSPVSREEVFYLVRSLQRGSMGIYIHLFFFPCDEPEICHFGSALINRGCSTHELRQTALPTVWYRHGSIWGWKTKYSVISVKRFPGKELDSF